jgi:hypothetical protein
VDSITIISGGQTGADRAALDVAIANGIPHGGWCPRGRMAEDGPIDGRYRLRETPSANYAQRTRRNIRDSDATVVFSTRHEISGGTGLTLDFARRIGKPVLHLVQGDPPAKLAHALETLTAFLIEHDVRTLNIAGPRASQEPRIGDFVNTVLNAVLTEWPQNGTKKKRGPQMTQMVADQEEID